MSYAAVAQQGLKAVEDSDWNKAVAKLSEALKSSQNPAWLIARSKALAGLGRPEASLEDADLAWHMAIKRSKRDLMASAQYRRGVAFFQMKQYANADYCLLHCMRLTKGGPAVPKEDPFLQYVNADGFWTRSADDALRAAQQEEATKKKLNDLDALQGSGGNDPLRTQMREWRMASTIAIQALKAMEKLPADDPARKLTTTLIPEQKDLVHHGPEKVTSGESASANAAPAAAPRVTKALDPNEPPFRMQDFQSDRNITVSIFSKGVDKDKLQVQFSETSVHLDPLVYSNGEQKEFHLNLWGEIDPSKSKYTVTPNKVELSLAKKTVGKWAAVQGDGHPQKAPLPTPELAAARSEKANVPFVDSAALKAADAKPTAYPTSSRTGPKNWDQVGVEENSDDEKDVNAFFKKLYKGATPEQQRAMMKSFTESNGTSLSTNWDDVKDKPVATVPPDGVEAKKWD